MFPHLKRECSRTSCTTVMPYSHHQPSTVMRSSRLYILLKSHYRSHTAFVHFRFISANVLVLRASMSPCSCTIDTLLSHHCNHLHIIHAVVTITPPSLQCVCMHQSRTKFPGMHFSIYHLFHYHTMFIFTWYTLIHTTITFYHHHTSYHHRVFTYVLNKTLQALVAVSSSGHICISVHVLTSL
jgi:hypothetical protein